MEKTILNPELEEELKDILMRILKLRLLAPTDAQCLKIKNDIREVLGDKPKKI